MLQLKIENEYGEVFDFTKTNDIFVKVAGLTPSGATINTSKVATKDGTKYNSSTLNERNITLTIFPQGNIEKNRINLYRYIRLGSYIKLYLKNGLRDVWIDGYVEDLVGDLYENPQQLQASIICTDPYFKSINPNITTFSTITPLFTFPFTITSDGVIISQNAGHAERNVVNNSDNKNGAIIELYSTDIATNPTIYNMSTNENFTINHEFQTGDIVRLDTRSGQRSLKLIRDGVETNILNRMERGSKWFELRVGDNLFSYVAQSGVENLQMTVEIQPIFTGV